VVEKLNEVNQQKDIRKLFDEINEEEKVSYFQCVIQ